MPYLSRQTAMFYHFAHAAKVKHQSSVKQLKTCLSPICYFAALNNPGCQLRPVNQRVLINERLHEKCQKVF